MNVSKWMPRLLLASIEPLAKMLKHSDWRALREGDNQERVAVLRAEARRGFAELFGLPSAIMEGQAG